MPRRTRLKNRYVQKIEKLQFQLEELMYEKDKIAYQWANAQKARRCQSVREGLLSLKKGGASGEGGSTKGTKGEVYVVHSGGRRMWEVVAEFEHFEKGFLTRQIRLPRYPKG